MTFFSGFSLKGESKLFEEFIPQGDTVVAGFSYGAQLAFEYALNAAQRIDRLVLISPAFFQTEKPSFVRTQLRYFRSDSEAYTTQFISNVSYPSGTDLSTYLTSGTPEELEALLSYCWEAEKFAQLKARGIAIEVFLGGKDKIINADAAFGFFSAITTTYLIKDAGHLLADSIT